MFRYEKHDKSLPENWIKNDILRGNKSENFYFTICEDHYLPTDIVLGSNGWKERLPGSVPSILKINLEACRFCLKSVDEKSENTEISNSVRSAFYELLDVGVSLLKNS
jgi:hypothetical protein